MVVGGNSLQKKLLNNLLLPINQKMPLRDVARIGRGGGPAVLQIQNDVGIRPVEDADLNIHRLLQNFGDWVVCCSVEGVVRRLFCRGESHLEACKVPRCKTGALRYTPSTQPFEKHSPLPSLSSTLRGPPAATGIGEGRSLTSMTNASTPVLEYLHWNSNLGKKHHQ